MVRMTKLSGASMRPILTVLLIAASILFLPLAPAQAQGLFSPVAKVNDRVITGFELQQRILLNRLLNAPGDLEELSLDQLIEDRLRLDAAKRFGIVVSADQIDVGMGEFAGRVQLSKEEFIKAINGGGVEETTFRAFVEAGIAWREVVRSQFVSRVQVSEAEVDRALALAGSEGGVRVLLSEIILPAHTPAAQASSIKRAERISQITTLSAFSRAARQSSVSPTRGAGGRLQWLPLSNLPPQIRPAILALRPGEVTAPIPIPNAIALFQMRAIEETEVGEAEISAIEYAAYYIPGGRSDKALTAANAVRAKVDTCDDLYGIAKDQPEETLERAALPPAEIPGDIALELAKLDRNEISTALTRAGGETLVVLMLCGRTPAIAEEVSRDTVRDNLRNSRLDSYANGLLAELKADAVITLQ